VVVTGEEEEFPVAANVGLAEGLEFGVRSEFFGELEAIAEKSELT